MVLKNLFTGQQWRNRHREYTYGHGKRRGEGEMYGENNMETYICCMAQETQTNTLLSCLFFPCPDFFA